MKISLFIAISSFFLAGAGRGHPAQNKHVQAGLLSEVTAIAPGIPFWLAVRLQMEEHWHTYWKNPGDAGLETRIAWKLPPGFTAGELQWPFPERMEEPPLVTFGYEDEVYLLAQIRPPDALQVGATVELKAQVSWLVCKDVCLPGEQALALRLPVAAQPVTDAEVARKFAAARKKIPLRRTEWRLRAGLQDSALLLTATPPVHAKTHFRRLVFFPDLESEVSYAAAQRFEAHNGAYRLLLQRVHPAKPAPRRISGVLVADAGWQGPGSTRALRIDLPVATRRSLIPLKSAVKEK